MKQELSTAPIADSNSFDRMKFRGALGQFPTGVAVITATTADGEDLGMTISSFNSVSLDPPLVLFSIDRRAHTFQHWMDAKTIGVNVLSEHQSKLSTQFSKPFENKWLNVNYSRGLNKVPLLDETVASFETVIESHHDGGDHVVFICRVVNFKSDSTYAPLIFSQGKYALLRQVN